MQTTTAQFKTTALAPVRQTVRQVTLALVDNISIGGTITPTGTSRDPSVVGPAKAVNGVTRSTRKWAAADHFANKAAGARFVARPAGDPNISYPISTTSEAGFWGNTLGDASGNIAGGEAFVITYDSPKLISTITWYGDALLGSPVAFTVDYDPTGSSGYTNVANVSGYTQNSYTYTFGSPTKCTKLRITITKTTWPFTVAKLVEFEGGLIVDASAQVKGIATTQERSPDNATLVIGNASAGQVALTLDNPAQIYNPHNANSAYQPYLQENRRIRISVGWKYSDGSTELVPLGTFYTMDWDANVPDDRVVIKAQDRMKLLRDAQYRTCPLLINQTVSSIIKQTLIDAGVASSDAIINPSSIVVPYAYCSPTTTFFTYLAQLAGVAGGVIYFDENDIFHFEDANFLKVNRVTSVVTLTDSIGLFSGKDSWKEGTIKNRIVVNVASQKLASSAQIWALQETLTVPAGGTLTIPIVFSGPATNVNTPSVTGGANISILTWTAYAYGGSLILQNTGLTDQTVTACTITGQLLQTDGSNQVIAQDAAQVAKGAKELAITNPLLQTRAAAIPLAYSLLSLYKNPPSMLHGEVQGLPHIELGDRKTINSSKMGINSDYWLQRHGFTDDGGFRSSVDLFAVVGDLPTRATLWNHEAVALNGGAVITTFAANQLNCYWAEQSPAAQNDSFTLSCFLRAGIYSMTVWGATFTDEGKIDWYLDGTLIMSGQDWYSGGSVLNVIQTLSSVMVTFDGYHVLKGVLASKNASSSSYVSRLTKVYFKQASD